MLWRVRSLLLVLGLVSLPACAASLRRDARAGDLALDRASGEAALSRRAAAQAGRDQARASIRSYSVSS